MFGELPQEQETVLHAALFTGNVLLHVSIYFVEMIMIHVLRISTCMFIFTDKDSIFLMLDTNAAKYTFISLIHRIKPQKHAEKGTNDMEKEDNNDVKSLDMWNKSQ